MVLNYILHMEKLSLKQKISTLTNWHWALCCLKYHFINTKNTTKRKSVATHIQGKVDLGCTWTTNGRVLTPNSSSFNTSIPRERNVPRQMVGKQHPLSSKHLLYHYEEKEPLQPYEALIKSSLVFKGTLSRHLHFNTYRVILLKWKSNI